MANVAQLAWDRGCSDPDGAGFFLVLTMKSGRVLRGSCHPPQDDVILMDVPDPRTKNVTPMFVNMNEVESAEIEW